MGSIRMTAKFGQITNGSEGIEEVQHPKTLIKQCRLSRIMVLNET